MADNTARERRMQRLKEDQRKEMPMKVAKGGGLIVLAILVIGGLGAAIYFSAGGGDDDCPGHWHATIGFFVEGERAIVPQPPYNFMGDGTPGRMPLSLHLHQGDMEQLHFEPTPRRCVGVQDALEDVGVELGPDSVAFVGGHEGHPHAGTYRNNDTHEVRIFIQSGGSRLLGLPADDEMREVTFSEVRDYQLLDGEKLMVAYGNHTDEELTAMMAQIRWPSGSMASPSG